ncbi:histidinol dehydrogenase [Chelativorans sp. SCAU2101]|jgi:histidinol dehydrogenase|uniref:Histidinol dehydrogenase n=1 Tax=Chelativorans petroleitrophicus TaxID=2975484 RepID=A0A9X2X7W3_9HYPH|nr:histidinol dehydrogenase [Chelativorans petroleitrophicus]MCT8990333.1 histidinol dehydrogenase [Chelativorans petroleitrophicus]
MTLRLSTADADFEDRFTAFLATKREASQEVDAAVREIIARVRAEGDRALKEYTKRFDRFDVEKAGMRVERSEIEAAYEATDAETRAALELAKERIEAHHRRQMPTDTRYKDALGVELGWRWTPISAVGLYVPGGLASYPSSVLMNAVPARVAGVERITITTPTPDGRLNPLVLVAADIAGVTEILRIGGAQAIAALAHGTETIAPVDKIVGPGNAWVSAAKRQVFGQVGIDMIAGPSEVLVVADGENDPTWIAADLLAQAEHDTAAQSILMTDDPAFAEAVAAEVERQLKQLSRAEIAGASWRDFGAIILLRSLEEAPTLIDRLAPEHLELATAQAESLLQRIRNAGAVFLGRHTPEVIGDYVGGSNHVLPTARSARFSSGLSVMDFLKRMSILRLDSGQLRALGPAAVTLARAEGLEAHGRAVSIRLNI